MANLPGEGVIVQLWQDGNKIDEKTCDAEGNCSFVVPDGTYSVNTVDFPCACDECTPPQVCTHYGSQQEVMVSNGQTIQVNDVLESV